MPLHWYKGIDTCPLKKAAMPEKVKSLSGCDLVGSKIGSIMYENKSNEMLRQPAGESKSKLPRNVITSAAPRVYSTRNNFEKNRQKEIKKLLRQDREGRKFQSHPVPNFPLMHRRLLQKNRSRLLKSIGKVTIAETPLTLIKSMEAQKRLEEQVLRRELSLISGHRPKLNRKESWRKPPFIPKIASTVIRTKPFNLRSVLRGREREAYNERQRMERALRWHKEATDWSRRWRSEYNALRSQTSFKAQPYRPSHFKLNSYH